MNKKIILRLSNEIGNQMFMYASAYSIAKKLSRILLLDDETSFLSKKNISKYGLDNFNITSNIAEDKFKFKNFNGYLKRKILKKIDFLKKKKNFYIEKKDKEKITNYNSNYLINSFDSNLYMEGHFESEKYFSEYKNEILKEFEFKNSESFKQNNFFKLIDENNSVAICLRQNRFTEGKKKTNPSNNSKSEKFSLEQINYINKSVKIIKSKINQPKFYLWSNDFNNIKFNEFNFEYKKIDLSELNTSLDKRALSLFLLSNCKHFIVTCSTFNWWGAWLAKNENKIIIRPSNRLFSDFKINNLDFWPNNWIKIE